MTAFKLFWVRADRQGDLDMGAFETREAAEAAIPAARDMLLSECGGDADRAEIEGGIFSIDETADDD